jgi:hypothetical protein
MPPTVNKILHGLAVAIFLISGLGATLTSFKAFLPPVWYQDAQNIVAVCAGLVLYMLASPMLKGWLPVQSPVAALDAARDRVLKDASKTAPTIALLPVLVFALALFGCGASMPQIACASNPALTTQAEVDACRAAARDASADVTHAVVVDATPVAKDGGK